MGLSIDQHPRLYAESADINPDDAQGARRWLARYADRVGLTAPQRRILELMLGVA